MTGVSTMPCRWCPVAASTPGRPGSGPMIGALSGVPGRSPADASTSVVLGQFGHQVDGGAEQPQHRPGGHLGVGALLDGRPDHHLAASRGTR